MCVWQNSGKLIETSPENQGWKNSLLQRSVAAERGFNMEYEKNDMAQASMILGILSIVGICCCYGGIVFGSLAILFALLSRNGQEMTGNGKIGLITGSIGMGISILMLLAIFGWGIADLLSRSFSAPGGGIHV